MKYQIYHNLSRTNVGKPYTCAKRARNRAEKLNLEIGGHRYSVKTIYPEAQ